MNNLDWSKYPNFSEAELKCSATGECNMDPDFMARLQKLRTAWGRPMIVTSAFRSVRHPIEAKKIVPGEHSTGRAVDIAIHGKDALSLLVLAVQHGFTRIGVQQKGQGRFIHLGDHPAMPPGIWSY